MGCGSSIVNQSYLCDNLSEIIKESKILIKENNPFYNIPYNNFIEFLN